MVLPRLPLPRTLAFFAIIMWMISAPFAQQIVGVRGLPGTLDWAMFGHRGSDTCLVRYAQRGPEGERPIDRFTLLGHADSIAAPQALRLLKSVDEAQALGATLCSKLGEGADLRLYARCPLPSGWADAASGEANLCAPPAGVGGRRSPRNRDAASAPRERP
jgi:hypothetical protein